MPHDRLRSLSTEMNTLFEEAVQEIQGIIAPSQAQEAAKALVKSQAFSVDLQLPPEKWFHWKCGIVAPCGCDCRSLNGFPKVRRSIDGALEKAMKSTFPAVDYIIGVANAGIPWAKTLAEHLNLPLAYVRSEPKAMGKGHLVECSPKGGQHAIIIEDVVVSGQSTINAIHAIHNETDVKVRGVLSIVNWNFQSMRKLLSTYDVCALTSYPFILSCAFQEGLIDEEGYRQLMTFYQNPQEHSWAKYYEERFFTEDWLRS